MYVELLVGEISVANKRIRIINGYGPQKYEDIQTRKDFWNFFEEEIVKATTEDCYVIEV